jgi:hypothetical protein
LSIFQISAAVLFKFWSPEMRPAGISAIRSRPKRAEKSCEMTPLPLRPLPLKIAKSSSRISPVMA